jgi:hypothetical protein
MSTNRRRIRRLVVAGSCLLLATAALAQTGVLFVEGDKVGIGTSTPLWPLHVIWSDPGIANVLWIQNSGPARITFRNTNAAGTWSFGQENNDRFVVNRAGTGTQEFAVAPNGDILVGASVVHSSSRDTKEGFQALDPEAVLDKVAQIPMSAWSYKSDPSSLRHVGPMAEDFYAAFGLGADDKHIAINDSAGVALVAIQGLHKLVEEKEAEIRRLDEAVARKDAELEDLSERLDRIESRLNGGLDGR